MKCGYDWPQSGNTPQSRELGVSDESTCLTQSRCGRGRVAARRVGAAPRGNLRSAAGAFRPARPPAAPRRVRREPRHRRRPTRGVRRRVGPGVRDRAGDPGAQPGRHAGHAVPDRLDDQGLQRRRGHGPGRRGHARPGRTRRELPRRRAAHERRPACRRDPAPTAIDVVGARQRAVHGSRSRR